MELPNDGEHALSHFALVDHDQQGVNSGLNNRGLGLVISYSDIGKGEPLSLWHR